MLGVLRIKITVHTLSCWWSADRCRAAVYVSGKRDVCMELEYCIMASGLVWMAS
jgi:hypothetical protein